MSISATSLPDTTYYNIESDASEYIELDDCTNYGNLSDEDLLETSTDEKEDTKYLSIFQSSDETFDKQVMSVRDVNNLKTLDQAMMDRTDKVYYRCKYLTNVFAKNARMLLRSILLLRRCPCPNILF